MTNLTWEITRLLKHNRDGSYSTQSSRKKILILIAKELKELGFNQMNIHALKEKHVVKLLNKWKSDGLSIGTIKNRMSHIRWCAYKVNVAHKIPSNQQLCIEPRSYITGKDKAVQLKAHHLERIIDTNLKFSVRLQSEFGLRREESIKFIVDYADKGTYIQLKHTWCKGKRSRNIPITTDSQRKLLDEIKVSRGSKSLIPSKDLYITQLNKYRNTIPKIGLGKGHGLRHNYAQTRYLKLYGYDCPVRGGKHQKDMTAKERKKDQEVRLLISEELGHTREQITAIYLGN